MLLGYARVSTDEQHLDLQLSALSECDEIYTDEISGASTSRPALTRMLNDAKAGDQIIVWRLDRLGRSLPHLIELVSTLGDRGIEVRSLTEQLDTSTPGGELIFHVMGALAQYERSLIRERTKAGMAAAKARGAKIGRPKAISDEQISHARLLIDKGEARRSVARLLRVSPSTLYRALAE